MDGLNIFHLSAKYFPSALSIFTKFLEGLDTAEGQRLIEILIERTSTHFGMTPLHIAAMNHTSDGLQILLSYNANIEATTKKGFNALHCAVRSGSEDCVEYLIQEAGIDVNDRGDNPNYRTPLQMIRTLKMAKLLIRHGANENAVKF